MTCVVLMLLNSIQPFHFISSPAPRSGLIASRRHAMIPRTLRDSSTAEQWTLDPLILVRIQVPQYASKRKPSLLPLFTYRRLGTKSCLLKAIFTAAATCTLCTGGQQQGGISTPPRTSIHLPVHQPAGRGIWLHRRLAERRRDFSIHRGREAAVTALRLAFGECAPARVSCTAPPQLILPSHQNPILPQSHNADAPASGAEPRKKPSHDLAQRGVVLNPVRQFHVIQGRIETPSMRF
jgi:hypothetical protein